MLKATLTIALAVLLSVLILVGGCQTITRDKEQQIRKYSRIADLNRRMLAEDWDTFWLLNRSSHLTRWHVRND